MTNDVKIVFDILSRCFPELTKKTCEDLAEKIVESLIQEEEVE